MKFSEAEKIAEKLAKGGYYKLEYSRRHYSSGGLDVECSLFLENEKKELKVFYSSNWEKTINMAKASFAPEPSQQQEPPMDEV